MHFLPNKSEIFISALRNSLHARGAVRGELQESRIVKKLKYRSLCLKTEKTRPVDIYEFFSLAVYSVLIRTAIKGESFSAEIIGGGSKYIKPEATAALFCELCVAAARQGGYVRVISDYGGIFIIYSGAPLKKEAVPLLKKINAVLLKIRNEQKYGIFFFAPNSSFNEKTEYGIIDDAARTATATFKDFR